MVKKLFRRFVIASASLYVISRGTTGLEFAEGIKTIALAGAALTASHYIVKPIINVLLLPINLVTFNLFKWISSAIVLYIVTLLVDGFKINGFFFGGYSNVWIDLPSITLSGGFAYVGFSIVISLATSLLYWFLKP